MERFHIIEDAAAILVSKGVYRQAKVYRRGKELFAAYGAGFIRLYQEGTALPNLRCEAIDVPNQRVTFDRFGKASLA